MKILAIRGKNLASLSNEFEIDFQIEPLASAGLYAITGTTGAGKSTLLDALCLALYERTPRLAKATSKGESVPDVGENTVTPSDPRTILRRGASEGCAEVDFVGNDGIAYRSRWSVRRSRNKVEGKLQNSDISLTRIHDGQVLGDHRKTETLRLIESFVGLNFDQFTRSVLLAQNDFAAFLKASDDERAELLQTLTGTETFSQISMQAFARMKAEKDRLEQLQTQLRELAPLATEARAEKEQQREVQTNGVKTLGEHKAVIEGHLRWHQQLDQLKEAESEAQKKLTTATSELVCAAPRQEQLALVEQVQSARPLWVEAVRLKGSVSEVEKSLGEHQAALTAATLQATTKQTLYEAANKRQADAESARTLAQPALDKAKELDATIQILAPQFDASKKAQEIAQQQLQMQHTRQEAANTQLAQSQLDLSDIEIWLQEHVTLQPLAEGWQLWDTLFSQAQDHRDAQEKAASEINTLKEKSKALDEAVSKARATLCAATSQSDIDSEKLLALTQACANVDIGQLVQDKKSLEVRRDHLQTASQLWQKRLDLQSQRLRLQSQLLVQQEVLAASGQITLEGAKTRPLLEQDFQSAEQSLTLAKLAASKGAETLRASLQSEQPCPVCGSMDHPYAGNHSPVADAVLQSLQEQVKVKRKALDELLQRLASALTSHNTAEQHCRQLMLDLAQIDTDSVAQNVLLDSHALRSEFEAVDISQRILWITNQQDMAKTGLAQLNQQEDAYRSQLQARDAAQLALDLTQKAVTGARENLNLMQGQQTTTSQAVQSVQARLDQANLQLDMLQSQLDAGFTDLGWRQSWHQNPSGFVAECREQVKSWSTRLQQKGALVSAIETSQIEIRAFVDACNQAIQQLQHQSDLKSTVESQLKIQCDQRNTLFEGKPVVEVESWLNEAIACARQTEVQLQIAWQQALATLTRWQESVRLSVLQLEKDSASSANANEQLGAWLAAFKGLDQTQGREQEQSLTLQALKTLLEVPTEWLTTEREALQQLKLAVETAQAVLSARQQTLAQHEGLRSTTEDANVLQKNLLQAVQELDFANETLSNLRLELSRDDDRLNTSESLRVAIDKQASTSRVWSQLSDLIGSSDGKKFRNFAQQYTLDILLSYGNCHLHSLTRRYRLQRIEDSLGLLVVDQDMGDEVRSVHSLSGGESFLVSLALALGLASLSSHRVKVESLFIDEGFGSLDADSLGVAMDALDNLQALGRKVGVISHVAEMTERIGTRVQVTRMAGGHSRVFVQ